MKRTVCVVVSLSLVGSQIAGCATQDAGGSTAKGAGIGAVAGAALGALAGGNKRAVATGAIAGAIIGAIAAHYYDQQKATRAEAERKYGGKTVEDRLEIEGTELTPAEVTAGTQVSTSVQYTTLSAQKDAQVRLTESRTLVGPQDTVDLAKREVVRAQGTHNSSMKFTMPGDMPKGNYTLVTTVTDGKQTKTSRNALRVI